jgi:uncharacterized repeat protein (TIGR03806 family)
MASVWRCCFGLIFGMNLLLAGCFSDSNEETLQREALGEMNLPVIAGATEVSPVNAFPNLFFSSPVYLTHAGDGSDRLFVVEQGGRIYQFENRADVTSANVYLDIQDRVLFGGEMGLLGLAFAPGFASNGEFYVYYVADNPRRSVLSRFTVSDPENGVPDSASEVVLLEVPQPYSNHNGGTIAFGSDGYLYIALGDGGAAGDPLNHGQNTETLLGAVLRIKPEESGYSVPHDNPFVSSSTVLPEIWAYGFRNPYRFSFDRDSGALWLADVGQGEIEEIDVVQAGGNYGWRWYEGSQVYVDGAPNQTFVGPVYEYDHTQGVSITGGYVYRGDAVPSLAGKYIYGDFAYSTVWALSVDDQFQALQNDVLFTSPQNISAFGEDESGELFLVGYGGSIYRLQQNEAGTASVDFPNLLSETRVFKDLASLTPTSGMIEYAVQTPLWSDYSEKRRWLGVPEEGVINFADEGPWTFPQGTVLVKHFEMAMVRGDSTTNKRLETRILVNSSSGWLGATYRWNEAETDAELVTAAVTEQLTIFDPASSETLVQDYFYPGPNDCLGCHTGAAGRVLGVRTRQINGVFNHFGEDENQLISWSRLGLFDHGVDEPSLYSANVSLDDGFASVAEKSRSYLDANCSFCHLTGGPTDTNLDFRGEIANADMNAIGIAPNNGDFGLSNAQIIAPGEIGSSVLLHRLQMESEGRMPPLGSSVMDESAVNTLQQWILDM